MGQEAERPQPVLTPPAWILLATFLASIAFHYPGWMTLDSTSQLMQARTMVLNDGHPPSMALIWSVFDRIVPGPFLMLLVNVVVHITAIWLLASCFKQLWVKALFFLSVYFFPPTFLTIGMIWKDTLMNGFLLLGLAATVAALLTLIRDKRKRAADLRISLAVIALFFAISFRHNAPAGGLAIASLISLYMLVRNDWLGTAREQSVNALYARIRIRPAGFLASIGGGATIAIALFLAAKLIFDPFVTNRQHFWQVLAFHDIAAISVKTNRDQFPPNLYDGMEVEVLTEHYVSYSVLPLTKDSGVFRYLREEHELAALADAWSSAIRTHPSEYFNHRWSTFKNALGAGEIHPWAPVISEPVPAIRTSLSNIEVAGFQKTMRKEWSDHIVRNEPIIFEPYIYFSAALLLLVALVVQWMIVGYQSLTNWIVAGVLLSGVGYEVSLFFVTPSPDFRYSTYMIFCTIAGLFIYAATFERSSWKKRPVRFGNNDQSIQNPTNPPDEVGTPND